VSGPLFYLIAGEPSGDRLGAALMTALRQARPDIIFAGVGGREMVAAGLDTLFDIDDLAVMGIVEVVPRLRTIMRRMRETTLDVLHRRPAALITIDSPAFSLRVAQRVRRQAPGIRTIHYVAPSVWAWRPGRARHMAGFVDHVLALLPFEPPYMETAGMSCDFVGHPIVEREPVGASDVQEFRARIGVGPVTPLLLVAPGSRKGEVGRLIPAFSETVCRLASRLDGLRVVVPVAETVIDEVTRGFSGLDPAPAYILPTAGERERLTGFAAADVALVASGTIVLEMAAACTPMVAAYRTSWLTSQIVRRLIRVDTANLVNLIAGGHPVPEFLQEFSTVEALMGSLLPLFHEGEQRTVQLEAFDLALTALGRGGEAPSRRAARSVLASLER